VQRGDGVRGEIGGGEEVAEALQDVAGLQHPEGGKVEEGEIEAADGGGLGEGDAGAEKVEEGG
jgi:hypothetical protein